MDAPAGQESPASLHLFNSFRLFSTLRVFNQPVEDHDKIRTLVVVIILCAQRSTKFKNWYRMSLCLGNASRCCALDNRSLLLLLSLQENLSFHRKNMFGIAATSFPCRQKRGLIILGASGVHKEKVLEMEGRLWTTGVISVRRRMAQVQHKWSSATSKRGSGHKAEKYGKELVSHRTNHEFEPEIRLEPSIPHARKTCPQRSRHSKSNKLNTFLLLTLHANEYDSACQLIWL